MHPIKILFDVGNVLIHTNTRDAFFDKLTELMLKHTSVKIVLSPEQRNSAERILFTDLEAGLITTQDAIVTLSDVLGMEVEEEIFNEAHNHILTPIAPNACLGLFKKFLARIPGSIGVASNMSERHRKLLLSHPFTKDVACTPRWWSYKMGVVKPDPEFFRIILRHDYIEPRRMLLLDDKEENLASAASLGIRTHLFNINSNTPNQLRGAILESGIFPSRK